MTVFACNPDESAGFSEKVCRYVVYECWDTQRFKDLENFREACWEIITRSSHPIGEISDRIRALGEPQDAVVEIAECDTKEAIGTMLVQLADDRAEIDSPAKVMALWDRLDERWITGTP